MSAIILPAAPPKRLAAREIVVAPRLPERPKALTGDVFAADGDITAECDTCRENGGKRYHVAGPRPFVKLALNEHHKMCHPDQIGVVLLNQPGQ